VDVTRLHEASHTELVQLAHKAGYPDVSRQVLEEDIIALLLGEAAHVEDPLQEVRERTYDFVQGNRRIMASQLSCDLYCPGCPHHKVVECYTTNRDYVDS